MRSLPRGRRPVQPQKPKRNREDSVPRFGGVIDKFLGLVKPAKRRKTKDANSSSFIPPYDLRNSLRRTRPSSPLPLDIKLSQTLGARRPDSRKRGFDSPMIVEGPYVSGI